MIESEKLVHTVLQAAEGEIIGRIRLQKIFYLLEQLGLGGGFRFSYHNFGPYSEDLTHALLLARILEKTIKEEKVSNGSGFYSIYSVVKKDLSLPKKIGSLRAEEIKEYISRMKQTSSVEIELAATIHWLRKKEKVGDWRSEIKARKASKAQDAAISKAEELLRGLGLAA
ncbi:MAG: hypothetical protein ACOY2B_12895 [Pseudomonadota bacterium]